MIMKPDVNRLARSANEAIMVLQKSGLKSATDYAVVLGLIANKIVEACVTYGIDKQTVIDDLCKSVRIMSK
jgi:hypothetical protein